tara:strand:- start:1770 stop:2156 length:387 start_codon:yes stop_codon:yes gene_type:complete
MKGLSPKFPIQFNNILGAYVNNLTLKDVIKQNFKNLLLTGPGERIMDNNFGVGLRRYFFEPMTSNVYTDIAERIHSQTMSYMSFITINDVSFNDGGTNDNLLGVTISYNIRPLREIDTLTIMKGALDI